MVPLFRAQIRVMTNVFEIVATTRGLISINAYLICIRSVYLRLPRAKTGSRQTAPTRPILDLAAGQRIEDGLMQIYIVH